MKILLNVADHEKLENMDWNYLKSAVIKSFLQSIAEGVFVMYIND